MEVSPRGGGNRISEILKASTGVNLIQAAVEIAVGKTYTFPKKIEYNGIWVELVLYSNKEAVFDSLSIDGVVLPYLVQKDVWVKKGDKVYPFTGANETIGTLIFQFDSVDDFRGKYCTLRNYIDLKTL